ncbi:MAG: hypothetical protein GXY25_01515 [Pirellulaceae bacterium]|jgi:multidrug efflux pump subunit AcrB|nr:hypothetical protein [Planctomycetota bacterium]NLY99193.1 hypothetical protein [Pirellulaceae bacterium]
MAPTETPTTENEALRKEIGAIEKEMATVKVVIRRASRTRLALLLIALALVGASIWAFYRLAMSFGSQENLNLLAEKARVRANESSKPAINHVRALAENSLPVLREAFSVQVEKDRSKYTETLTRERDLLVKTLESQLDEKIRAHFHQISLKYQAILREEFPELEDPKLLDQMYSSVVDIMERLVEEYYSDRVRNQIEEMNRMWLEFDVADLPAEGETPLEQQFMASVLHLAALKIDRKSVELGAEAGLRPGP